MQQQLTGPNADTSGGAPVAQAAADLQAGARHKAEPRQAGGATVAARCCHRAVVAGSILRRSGAWTRAACMQQTGENHHGRAAWR
jgi:hypothetical protein